MAEVIFKSLLLQSFSCSSINVFSRGLHVDETEMSPHACAVLKKRGIEMKAHRPTPFDVSELPKNVYIFGMTCKHIEEIKKRVAGKVSNIFPLTEFVGREGEISDPYGKDIEEYSRCADELFVCLLLLLKKTCLISNKPSRI